MRRRRDEGSLTAEAVLLCPLLAAVLLLVIGFGRLERAAGQVADAARGAAEEAVVWPTASQAASAARDDAASVLQGDGATCSPFDVSVNTSEWSPGGNVEVTVSCTVSLADAMLPGMPGSFTIHRSVTAPIETYRSLQ